jgi:hypothetical protein
MRSSSALGSFEVNHLAALSPPVESIVRLGS